MATGADKIFIGDGDTHDVDADRKLPLATTRDIRSGQVQWQGQVVINPFADDGRAAYQAIGALITTSI